jgi:uncharacterized membrane protein
VAALLLAQSELPEPTGGFRVSPTFFVVLFGVGFALGAVGHLTRSRVLVAVGVLLVFLATVAIPIALHASR